MMRWAGENVEVVILHWDGAKGSAFSVTGPSFDIPDC